MVAQVQAALILLDPLMSRLDAKLDTHKDAEVRLALEPLVSIADRSGARDPRTHPSQQGHEHRPAHHAHGVAGIRRRRPRGAVLHGRPRRRGTRVLGQPKNNLGRTDLPTLAFRIVSAHVADTEEGPVYTGRVDWTGETPRSLSDVLEAASEGAENRTATQEAGDWLVDWLTSQGGTDESASIKREGAKAGHSQDSLKRARRRSSIVVTSEGFPRRTYWSLSEAVTVGATRGESAPTALTTPTALTDTQSVQLVQSVQSNGLSREDAP